MNLPRSRDTNSTMQRPPRSDGKPGVARFAALAAALAVASVATLFAPPAVAEFTTLRGDIHRTGSVPGVGRITRPAVKFAVYLGGDAQSGTFVPGVVDDVELVFLAAGEHVEARRYDDTVLWRSPQNGARELLGVTDLDGDGTDEVVALSAFSGRALVLDAATGVERWISPLGRYPAIGGARLHDVTGDGRAELLLASSGSGALVGSQLADVYAFDGDVTAGAPIATIELTTHDYDRGRNASFADLDGDGRAELIFEGHRRIYAYDGATGVLRYEGAVGPVPYAQGQTIVADLDGDGDDELLLFTNESYGAENRRHVQMVDLDAAGVLVPRWEYGVVDLANDRHAFVGDSVIDVDGDGTLEVVGSLFTASVGAWTTYVLGGADGALVASVPGHLVGAVDIDGGGEGAAEILVSPGPDELGVTAFSVRPAGPELRFSIAGARVLRDLSLADRNRQSLAEHAITVDPDGAGPTSTRLLLAVEGGGEAGRWSLRAFDATVAPPSVIAEYSLPEGVTFSSAQRVSLASGGVLLVARTDGYMVVLNHAMQPLNQQRYATGVVPGIKIGGYFTGWRGMGAAPLVADLVGDAGEDIVLRDARKAIVLLDTTGAGATTPPRRVWEVFGERWYPALVDLDGDGRREVVTGDAGRATGRRAEDGSVLFTATVGGGTTGYPAPIDMDGDGAEEVAYTTHDASTGEQVFGIVDASGAARWPAEYRRLSSSSGFGGFAMTDFTGDGVPDMVAHPGNFFVALDGATGAQLSELNIGKLTSIPILHDADDDGTLEAAVYSADVFTMFDLGPEGAEFIDYVRNPVPAEVSYYQYGALVACPDGARIAYSVQNSPRLRVAHAGSITAALDVYVAHGAAFTTREEAFAAGLAPPYLGNVNAASDFAGDGEPRLIVGSADGNLYVLHACADRAEDLIDWSYRFDAPVGEPVPADLDGDGDLEILVSVKDGHLYVIDHEPLAGPLGVGEGPHGIPVEFDEIETLDRITVHWEPVDGATGYEVAILDGVGAVVTEPEFVAVGPGDEAVLTGVPLELGATYYTLVRAVGAGGERSFERRSDGFRRVDRSPPQVTLRLLGDRLVAEAADATGLLSLTILRCGVVDDDGCPERSPVLVLGGGPVSGLTATVEASSSQLAPGRHRILAEVLDVAGKQTRAELIIELAVAPPIPTPEPGGCSCRAAGGGRGPGTPLGLLSLSLLAVALTVTIGRRRARA